jgi:TerC family integral membrane protein
MHAMGFMHLVFGGFLVYTGIQALISDDEEDDPAQQPMVQWLQRHMKFVNVYDSKGAFFVQCPINADGEADIPEHAILKQDQQHTETSPLIERGESDEEEKKVDIVDFSSLEGGQQRTERRATMLFLVCFCLNLCDLLFAVDSVSAIVAAVSDLFLAYTSAVFAMLGMRAIYFLIDAMVAEFEYLKYGVSFILVFIGVKLIIGKFYHIPSSIVCAVLFGALGFSMLASAIQWKMEENAEKFNSKMSPEIKERVAKMKGSPFTSPIVPNKRVM